MNMMEDGASVNKQMENFIAQQQQLLQSDHASKLSEDGDDSSLDELANGEILHCLFPGCLKEFTSRWSLTRHTRTHTGERPFKCSVCAKEFVQKCSLKRHEQTHSNDKQWICDFPCCGKRFKLKEYLDVHKRTHNKAETESFPVEDEDQVIQDAADAAGSLIDQLRQRLVRMSVCHGEQLFAYQQRELELAQALRQCTHSLQSTVNYIDMNVKTNSSASANNNGGGGAGGVPIEFIEAVNRFTALCNSLPPDTNTNSSNNNNNNNNMNMNVNNNNNVSSTTSSYNTSTSSNTSGGRTTSANGGSVVMMNGSHNNNNNNNNSHKRDNQGMNVY